MQKFSTISILTIMGLILSICGCGNSDEKIAKLIEKLGKRRRPDVEEASRELRKLGKPAEKALYEALHDTANNDDVREEVGLLLLSIDETKYQDEFLNSSDSLVREVVVRSLGEKKYVPILNKIVLEDESVDVRGAAASILGSIGDKTAVPFLIQALNKRSSYIRIEAAKALGDIKDRAAIPHLRNVISNKDEDDGTIISVAIDQLGSRFVDIDSIPCFVEALSRIEFLREAVDDALFQMDLEAVVPKLINVMQDSEGRVKATAISLLKEYAKQDFGADATKWKKWWKENKERLLKEKAEKYK